jgi:hypothetical protein
MKAPERKKAPPRHHDPSSRDPPLQAALQKKGPLQQAYLFVEVFVEEKPPQLSNGIINVAGRVQEALQEQRCQQIAQNVRDHVPVG